MSARVLHASEGGLHVIRYLGRISYLIAPALEQFLNDLLERSDVKGVVFDVSEAESIDSTNFGLLARFAERVRRRTGKPPTLVSPRPDLNEFLRSMSFGEIFDLVTSFDGPSEAREIPADKPSEGRLLDTMLDAHRSLIALSEENRARFQDVVVWLEVEGEARLRS